MYLLCCMTDRLHYTMNYCNFTSFFVRKPTILCLTNIQTTMKIKATLLLTLLAMGSTCSYAQLSKNPNKFLGNITTAYAVRSDFSDYWNQLTPENLSLIHI